MKECLEKGAHLWEIKMYDHAPSNPNNLAPAPESTDRIIDQKRDSENETE